MTTCAVKVDYAHLIDIARTYIEDHYRRPITERFLRRMLAEILPYPRRFSKLRCGWRPWPGRSQKRYRDAYAIWPCCLPFGEWEDVDF